MHAYAKLNLYLHVLGRRADGFHNLETLVAFTELADTLTFTPADTLTLALDGPYARQSGPVQDNLVMKAAQALQKASGTTRGGMLALTKNIPPGAGLGGGSADAAIALQLLNDAWKLDLPVGALKRLACALGADVAMCLEDTPILATGIGETITPQTIPPLHTVLVYPNKALSTAQVYDMLELPFTRSRRKADGAGVPDHPAFSLPGKPCAFREYVQFLGTTRNDLQRPAIGLMPEVAEVLLALETAPGPTRLVRMTGSGSCCFALVERADAAKQLAVHIATQHPRWWVLAAALRQGASEPALRAATALS